MLARAELGLDADRDDDGPWAVLSTGGDLLAVYEARDRERVKPAVVLA